jgi:hypothetical protein
MKDKSEDIVLAELKKIESLGDDPIGALASLPGNQYHQLVTMLERSTGFPYDEIVGILEILRDCPREKHAQGCDLSIEDFRVNQTEDGFEGMARFTDGTVAAWGENSFIIKPLMATVLAALNNPNKIVQFVPNPPEEIMLAAFKIPSERVQFVPKAEVRFQTYKDLIASWEAANDADDFRPEDVILWLTIMGKDAYLPREDGYHRLIDGKIEVEPFDV